MYVFLFTSHITRTAQELFYMKLISSEIGIIENRPFLGNVPVIEKKKKISDQILRSKRKQTEEK